MGLNKELSRSLQPYLRWEKPSRMKKSFIYGASKQLGQRVLGRGVDLAESVSHIVSQSIGHPDAYYVD